MNASQNEFGSWNAFYKKIIQKYKKRDKDVGKSQTLYFRIIISMTNYFISQVNFKLNKKNYL